MKIQEDKTIRQAIRTEPQNKSAGTNDEFKKVLSEVQSKINGAQGKSPGSIQHVQGKPLKVPPAPGVAGLTDARLGDTPAAYDQGEVSKVAGLLESLESYAQALSDPGKNLKDMAPLVCLLERDLEQLSTLGQGMPEGDMLKDLARQTLILAQVEVARFNRGDYL